jgi:hypothetical protein
MRRRKDLAELAFFETREELHNQRLVELPNQLLEDRPHRRVVDDVGMEVDLLEALNHLEQQPGFVEFAEGVVEVESLDDLAHIQAEASDVIPQVGLDVGVVGDDLLEIVSRGVVEGEARRSAELRVQVFEP